MDASSSQAGSASKTCGEVLARLRQARAEFDGLLAHVPRNRLEVPAPGHHHSPKEIVAHVSSYEEMTARTLRSTRLRESSEFAQEGFDWQQYNDQVWEDAKRLDAEYVLERSAHVFSGLVDEVSRCTEEEFGALLGMRLLIDESWAQAESIGDLIGIAAFEHYPRHYEALDDATRQPPV